MLFSRKQCWLPFVFPVRTTVESAGEVVAVGVKWETPFCSLLRCVQMLSALDEAVLKRNLLLLGSCWRGAIEREECFAVWRKMEGQGRVFASSVWLENTSHSLGSLSLQKHDLGNAYLMAALIVNYCYLTVHFQNPSDREEFFLLFLASWAPSSQCL